MKKISILAASALVLAFSFTVTSCNKVKEVLAQNIPNIMYEDDKPVITIPASTSTDQQTAFGTFNFDLNQYVKDHVTGTGIDFSYIRHIYVKSITATVINGDAGNNFSNMTYTTTVSPALVFNTTPDVGTATLLGGNITTPPADPFYLVIPVTNNADILSHINGRTWAYGFTYKLAKATTTDMRVKLDVKYEISFK